MKRTFVLAMLLLGVLSGQAQEKVMNVVKTDGTTAQTRVAELKQLSFLTVEEGGQGLIVKTTNGDTVGVLFETNPVVTVASGSLSIQPSSEDAIQFEIADIAEIVFGDASSATPVNELKGFAFVLQDGGALLRGIPQGVKPHIFTIDGRSLPTPPFRDGELRLSRETLGSGVFIVRVGTFATKVRF